jgi:hypothetical protein
MPSKKSKPLPLLLVGDKVSETMLEMLQTRHGDSLYHFAKRRRHGRQYLRPPRAILAPSVAGGASRNAAPPEGVAPTCRRLLSACRRQDLDARGGPRPRGTRPSPVAHTSRQKTSGRMRHPRTNQRGAGVEQRSRARWTKNARLLNCSTVLTPAPGSHFR